jgi:deoxyribose-phosphate aldolase
MRELTPEALAWMIDQTNLNPAVTHPEMADFVRQSSRYGFRTVAIMTSWVPLASQVLGDSPTSIVASVGFPLGAYPTGSKVAEARWAIANGRSDLEVDMVMNMPLFKARRYQEVEADIRAVREVCEGHILKVIIEVPLLNPDEIIIASQVAERAGVDFVKTSTGFRGYSQMRASTPEDVSLVRSAVGRQVQVKIAGGVLSLEQALLAIHAGATRIGTVAGIPIRESLEQRLSTRSS